MIPIRDENPTLHTPLMTFLLVGMNIFVWFTVQGMGEHTAMAEALCRYALIPGDLLATSVGTIIPVGGGLACQLDGNGQMSTIFSSMFMHGGWLHLAGNMLFLWIFGDNVEDIMGPLRFAVFFALCGAAAAVAQIATDLDSTVPMVGASGAIGGVLGAYALSFPRTRVHLFFIFTTVSVPAIFVLGYWFVLQLLSGLGSLGYEGGGVAFWAHIGGFVAGSVLVFLFRDPERIRARRAQARRHQAGHRWL
ncbi:MAG: rhomboid family intramembrane serine protease [Pseudomonadota bacterium]